MSAVEEVKQWLRQLIATGENFVPVFLAMRHAEQLDAANAENERLRTELSSAITQRDLARSDYTRDRVRMSEVVAAQNLVSAAKAELATARNDAERHAFAMRHVSYYTMQGEFIVDCARARQPNRDASLDYEKAIDAALKREGGGNG